MIEELKGKKEEFLQLKNNILFLENEIIKLKDKKNSIEKNIIDITKDKILLSEDINLLEQKKKQYQKRIQAQRKNLKLLSSNLFKLLIFIFTLIGVGTFIPFFIQLLPLEITVFTLPTIHKVRKNWNKDIPFLPEKHINEKIELIDQFLAKSFLKLVDKQEEIENQKNKIEILKKLIQDYTEEISILNIKQNQLLESIGMNNRKMKTEELNCNHSFSNEQNQKCI